MLKVWLDRQDANVIDEAVNQIRLLFSRNTKYGSVNNYIHIFEIPINKTLLRSPSCIFSSETSFDLKIQLHAISQIFKHEHFNILPTNIIV